MIRWFQIFLIKHLLGTLHLIQKKRSKLVPHNKYQYSYLVSEHIETYHPTISHYRREHAPNTRYLPSNINVTMMHQDFIEKYPEHSISYDFYKGKIKEKKFLQPIQDTKNVSHVRNLSYTVIIKSQQKKTVIHVLIGKYTKKNS